MADVGGIIAQHHSKRLDCPVCGVECEPVIVARTTRQGDHIERLRCTYEGETFKRIWIGGYR